MPDLNNTIMVQGTASYVGKSLITTALCRILAQDGYRVAPFKAWNMSLNSFVTFEGGEIGISQAIQAEAAGIEPVVDMQPVLVKPKGNGLSQVILKGKPYADLSVQQENKDYLSLARQVIKDSLSRLKERFEIVVMEGAGSPAEINVRNHDLANMMVARLYKSPVILVADIDRGGVFASLVGTIKLLEPEEQELVKGFIINRFRGDYSLLKPGLDFLEEYTEKPVLGVVPYLNDIDIPEEDSVGLQSRVSTGIKNPELRIGVVNLPHISNFTDFASLAAEVDVSLKYITEPAGFNNLDLIIIPGTKSTTSDLEYLKKRGFARQISKLSQSGVPVIGICGGYQMMGKWLLDPDHTEGKIEEIRGLDILPVETHFISGGKMTHQVKAVVSGKGVLLSGLKGSEVTGYEIHMGETNIEAQRFPFEIIQRSGKQVAEFDGAVSDNGLHFGTYLHGLFNSDDFRRGFLDQLRKRKGLKPIQVRGFSYIKRLQNDYDELAAVVRKNIQLDFIYELLNIHKKGK